MHELETEVIDGVGYYVIKGVPVVKSMVLNGAYLPLPEIKKTIEAWNMKPVVFGHTKEGEEMVSAAKVSQIAKHYGFITNAIVEKDRMRADLYLKKQKIDSSSEGLRLLDHVRSGIQINVSTAYFDQGQPGQGVKDGREFDKIQTNIAPDHLAILLDEDGACNTKDGCGINVNNDGVKQMAEHIEGVSESIADSVATFLVDLEAKVLATNAASAAGSAQSFETCKKELKELKDRMDKFEKKRPKKKEMAENAEDEELSDDCNTNADEDDEDYETMKRKKKKEISKNADEEERDEEEDEKEEEEEREEKRKAKKMKANSMRTIKADFSRKSEEVQESVLNYNSSNPYYMPNLGDYLRNKGDK